MKFERDEPKCSFEIPDRPTVRQQLEYFSATAGAAGNQMLIRFWAGALQLVTKWECEALPDYKTGLDDMTDPKQADIIIWAGIQVKNFMSTLDDVPKN